MKKILMYVACIATFAACKKEPVAPPVPIPLSVLQITSAGLPAGCLSPVGYSPITGEPCFAQTDLQVSQTSGIDQLTIFRFTLKALHGDILIKSLPIEFSGTAPIGNVISSATLVVGGIDLDVEFPQNGLALFDDIDIRLRKNETIDVTVVVDIKSAANYPGGTKLQVKLLRSRIDAEDTNLDTIPEERIVGTAYGSIYTLLTRGVITSVVGTSIMVTGGTKMFKITLRVSAFGADAYFGKTTNPGEQTIGTAGFAWVAENDQAPDIPIVNGIAAVTYIESSAFQNIDTYRIDEGTTETVIFTADVSQVPMSGYYRMRLAQIKTFSNSAQSMGEVRQDLLPMQEYRTGFTFF